MNVNQYEDLFYQALSQRFSAKDFWIHCERIAGALKQFYEDDTAYEIGASHFYETLPEDTRRFMTDVYNLAADSIEFGPEKLAQHYWPGYGKQEPFFRHLRDTSIEEEYTGVFGQIMDGCGLDREVMTDEAEIAEAFSEDRAFLLEIAAASREQMSREALARGETVCLLETKVENENTTRWIWSPEQFAEFNDIVLNPEADSYRFAVIGSKEFRNFLMFEQPENGPLITLRLDGTEDKYYKAVQDFIHPDFLRDNGDEIAILLAYFPAEIVMEIEKHAIPTETALSGLSKEQKRDLAFDIGEMIDEHRGIPEHCCRGVMYRQTGIDVFEHSPELSPDQRPLSEIGMTGR